MVNKKRSLNLVVLRSPDLERAKSFYENLLSCKFDEHLDHGPKHYGISLGEVYLEIYSTKENRPSIDSFGFHVPSIDEVINKLGNECIHRAARESSFGRYAIIKDPDNRLVHISED